MDGVRRFSRDTLLDGRDVVAALAHRAGAASDRLIAALPISSFARLSQGGFFAQHVMIVLSEAMCLVAHVLQQP